MIPLVNQPLVVLDPKTTEGDPQILPPRVARIQILLSWELLLGEWRMRANRAGVAHTKHDFPRVCWHFQKVGMGKIPVGKTMNVSTSQFLGFHFFALLYVEMDSTWVAWNNKMKNAVEGVQAKLTQIEYINAHTHTKKKNPQNYCLYWEAKIYKTKADIKEEIVYLFVCLSKTHLGETSIYIHQLSGLSQLYWC